MNRIKKLYALIGIFAFLCVVTFGVSKYKEKKEIIKNSDATILALEPEAIISLSWEYESDSFTFHKEEQWIYDMDEAFPVSEEKLNELLVLFQNFEVSFVIEEVKDYGQYGLDDPICTIHLETEAETYEVLVGDYSTMDSQRYVSIGDGNVYLVEQDPVNTFDVSLRDLIEHDEIPDFDTVDSITFTGSQNYQIVYEEENSSTYCKEDVYFTEQNGEKLALDTTKMQEYLQFLGSLKLKDYVTYHVSDTELETYGLKEPELTIKVEYTGTEKHTFLLEVGCVKKTDEDQTTYVRVNESKIIYQITGDQYESLVQVSYNDLRHLELLTAAFSDICQIDILLEEENYMITVKEENEEKAYYYGEEKIDIANFQSMFMSLESEEFTEQEATGKLEIGLKVYLTDENHSPIHIELYRYDGEFCLAMVDQKALSFVRRTDVIQLIEAVNAIVLNK